MTPVESRVHLMLDVGIGLVEALGVGLSWSGLERGVHVELDFCAEATPANASDAALIEGEANTLFSDRHAISLVMFQSDGAEALRRAP
jgi:hypothetical protein